MKKYKLVLLIVFLIATYFFYNEFFKVNIFKYVCDKNYDILEVNNKLLKIGLKNKYGVLTNTGEVLLPLEFDELEIESDGKIIAKIKNKYGVLTFDNKKYLEFTYDNLENINSKYYKARKDSSVFLIEKKNKKNIKFEETLDIKYFNNKYFVIKKDSIEIFDENFNKNQVYFGNDIYYINEKIFLLRDGEDYYLISGNKKVLYSENIEQICGEYLVINENDKRGIKKIGDDKFILIGYDTIYMNGKDSIIVQKNEKYGVINIKNKTQISCQYDKISSLYQGYYAIELDFKCGLINEKGNIILPLEYEAITNFNKYFAIVYTEKGEEIIFFKKKNFILSNFDEVIFFDDDKLIVQKDDNVSIYNKKGKEIISLKQNEIRKIGKDYIITNENIINFKLTILN